MQYCIIALLEKWHIIVDQSHEFWVILIDLSKAVDCLLHILLFVKLSAYGFDMKALFFLSKHQNWK